MPIKIGLSKFDSIFKKGIPDKSSILLLGPPKTGKTLFGLHFLFEGLRNNEHGIYIVTNSFPEDVVKRLENFGRVDKVLQNGLLKFVDCYSIHAGVHKDNTVFIVRVNGPTALNEIGMAFSEIIKLVPKSNKIRVVFDSVSTLLMFNKSHTIETFVQQMNGKIKSAGATSVFILEEGIHDEKSVTAINSMLDMLVHLKKVEDKKMIEIDGFGVEKSINYSIKNNKITFN